MLQIFRMYLTLLFLSDLVKNHTLHIYFPEWPLINIFFFYETLLEILRYKLIFHNLL
jgi:hypothetical protein